MCKLRVNILFLWGLLWMFTGCSIKENLDDCPVEKPYLLSFIYTGDGTTDIFKSKTENVRLYLFDTDGEYLNLYTLSKAQLNEFQGIKLELSPGDYEVVCWSNITQQSEVTSDKSTLNEHYLYSSSYLAGMAISDFDSLYYGRKTITIPTNGGEDTVYFQSSHINIEVHVVGLESTVSKAVGNPDGWLKVVNASVGYDFRMHLTPEQADMFPDWNDQPDGDTLVSRFNLLRFNNENDILIDIYNSEGRRVYSLALEQFIKNNNLNVEGVNEATISITITFKGTFVHVFVTGWDSGIIEPIF